MHRLFRVLCMVLLPLILLAAIFLIASQPISKASPAATTLHVNVMVDGVDDGACGGSGNPENGGGSGQDDCTLREAVGYANRIAGGAYDIVFDSSGTISMTQGSLVLTGGQITIDGDRNDDGTPDVALARQSGTGSGIILRSSSNRVEGLMIYGFQADGIYVDGNGSLANDNQIVNCYIGTDGTRDLGNSNYGISIDSVYVPGSSGADNTLIQGNLIAGNNLDGIFAMGPSGTTILSNTVGANLTGTAALANRVGIFLYHAQTSTVAYNLVSGNSSIGLNLQSVTNTVIAGNTIGANRSGTAALANSHGIYVIGAVTLTIRGNLVSSNVNYGMFLSNTLYGTIAGNKVGVNAAGTDGLGNGRIGTSEEDGVTLINSSYVTIGGPTTADRNIISHNGRSGVWLDNSHNNTIQNNYIGTDVTGVLNLGNDDYSDGVADGAAGIYVKDGSSNNLIQGNLIRFNYIGVRFSGGDVGQGWDPPMDNDVLTNTITSNAEYGILNKTTHRNTAPYTTRSDGDNLIQGNVITGTGARYGMGSNRGIGIYNHGGSPYIINNLIAANGAEGIMNAVYIGVDGAANYADDLLSMPYIYGNEIRDNRSGGINSRDTTPVNKATLLGDNTFTSYGSSPRITQRWVGAVEVISNGVSINSGMAVTITRAGGEPPNTCRNGNCYGSAFSDAGGGNGIWGPTGIRYHDVETTTPSLRYTWFEIVEYEVDWNGNWITYTPHLVRAGGAYLAVRYFNFDGVTTTAEISGDTNLPTCVATGILSDANHTLCRYQIVQLNAVTEDDDYDDDGIPTRDECPGGVCPDTDGDGTIDPYDSDDDGDGILTIDECPGGFPYCPDTDGDGTTDPYDDDDDGDGILTIDECPGGLPCPDTDGDGISDPYDMDDDNDGILTKDECPGGLPCPDTDGDGTSDPYDMDDDNDGIPSQGEVGACTTPGPNCICYNVGTPNQYCIVDSDGDGKPDVRDTDSNNNGIPDSYESGLDTNGDGNPDCPYGSDPRCTSDNDGDGIVDWLDPDYNDADGDGIVDPLDPDADGDGYYDDCDATPPAVHAPDRDCDGIPDHQDTDNDNDGIPDLVELDAGTPADPECPNGVPGANHNHGTDANHNGTPDCLEVDTDGDHIPDYMDPDTPGDLYPDADGDGIPNHLDKDSDDDGRLDKDEGVGDSDGDGIPNFLDREYRLYLPLVMRNYS